MLTAPHAAAPGADVPSKASDAPRHRGRGPRGVEKTTAEPGAWVTRRHGGEGVNVPAANAARPLLGLRRPRLALATALRIAALSPLCGWGSRGFERLLGGGSVSPQKLHDVLTLEPRDGQTPEELVGLRRGLLDGPASRLTTVLAGRRRGQTPEGVCAAGRPGEEAATGGRLQAEERARRSRVQPAARPPGRGGDPACSVSHQPLVQPALRHRGGRPGCSGQRWRWPPTRHGSLHGCSPGPGPPEAPARKRGPAW